MVENSWLIGNRFNNFIELEVFQMRLRDGRTIYCDDDGRWFLSGASEHQNSYVELLLANGLLKSDEDYEDAENETNPND